MSQQASLLDQILSGTNRNLQVLAAQGLVPLPPEDLLPIQVALAGSPDPDIAQQAQRTLGHVDTEMVARFLREQAGERELEFFSRPGRPAALVEAVIRRPDTPRHVLAEVASTLPADLQEILVHRQDAILEMPEILVGLEQNPQLSSYTKRRIWEYREHLLPKDKVPPKSAEELLAEVDSISDEEMEEAIAEVKAQSAIAGEEEEGPVVDSDRGLSDNEIRLLPVPMRVKIARKASRQVRALLIRDPNSMVAVTVITANTIPDSEVEAIANNRSVCEEVLNEIARKREWIKKYSIARALVKNPKTPLPVSMKLVPRMTVKDLRELAKDKNASEGVRQMARRLYINKR